MKSAKEWIDSHLCFDPPTIEAIQRDALEAAAKACEQIKVPTSEEYNGSTWTGYQNIVPDNRECIRRIRALLPSDTPPAGQTAGEV